MNKTKCVIRTNSPGVIATAVLGIIMIVGTIIVYRYDTNDGVWWTAIMTPDKYNTVQGVMISFVFRIICGISMFSVFFASRSLNVAMIPAAAFILTSAISSTISGDSSYILSLANAVCLAFIAYIFLFQRVKLLRKNKWIEIFFALPIIYYFISIATGKMTDSYGYIYFSSIVYFSLMFLSFTVIGLSAVADTEEDVYEGNELL